MKKSIYVQHIRALIFGRLCNKNVEICHIPDNTARLVYVYKYIFVHKNVRNTMHVLNVRNN